MRFCIPAIFLAVSINLAASFDLKCHFSDGGWKYVGVVKTCSIPSIVIMSPNETITSVNGDTTPRSIEGLTVMGKNVLYMPKGIGKFFPQLKALQVHACNLKSIQAADLEGLTNLEHLEVGSNTLEEVPGDLFKFTRKINYIVFNNNQISRVGRDLFKDLYRFKLIDFSSNKCISHGTSEYFETIKKELRDKCAEPIEQEVTTEIAVTTEGTTVCEIPTTKKPEISQKEIDLEKEIERLKEEIERMNQVCYNGLLNSATKLLHKKAIKLKECREGKPDNNVIEEADVVLKVARVTDSTAWLEVNVESRESWITRIVNAFGHNTRQNQTEVIIHQQNALFLPVNLGQLIPSLNRLSVTFSGLYRLDTRTFQGMQVLDALNLTGNKLIEISENDFWQLRSLKELDLSRNNIEIIHEEAFAANVELETLKLNNNQLVSISRPIFRYQQKLRSLYLNDNRLKTINAALLSSSNALGFVDLRNNDCINLSLPSASLKEIETRIMLKCFAY